MSTSNSPWSIVGLFMGAPKLRTSSRKRMDRNSPPVPDVQPFDNSPQNLKASPQVGNSISVGDLGTVAPSSSSLALLASRETHMTTSRNSSEHHLDITSSSREESPDEQEHDWTSVASVAKQNLLSSAATFETTPDTDDIVDVLSQSVSIEFLEQQTQPQSIGPSPSLSASLNLSDANELSTEEAERKNMEERLKIALRELADVDRRNRELEDENHKRGEEVLQLKDAVAALEGALLDSKAAGVQAVTNVEDCQKRCRNLEESLKEKSMELESMEQDLAVAQQGREEAQERVEEGAKRCMDLEEQSRRLLNEYRDMGEESQRLRGINSEAEVALSSALSDLKRAGEVEAQLKDSMARNKDITEQNALLRNDLTAARKELVEARFLHMETKKTLDISLVELKSLSEEKAASNERIIAQKLRMDVMEKKIQSMTRLGADATRRHSQIEDLERRNRMLLDQLRRQSIELRQKSPFSDILAPRALSPVARADLAASVLSMINRINSDIFQVAAHMSESLEFDSKTDEENTAIEQASVVVGRPISILLNALAKRDSEDFNPLPVQIGLQACLTSCTARILTSWCPGHWDYADFVAVIYSRIAGTTPGLASRWRAITERQLKTPSDATVQAEMEEYIFRNLSDVLTVAGWRKSPESTQGLVDAFHERITQITKVALRVNMMLGDELEILLVHSDEAFDDEMMDDAYEGYSNEQDNSRVVCMTDLGLKLCGDGDIVLKPKVVLQAMVKEETGYLF